MAFVALAVGKDEFNPATAASLRRLMNRLTRGRPDLPLMTRYPATVSLANGAGGQTRYITQGILTHGESLVMHGRKPKGCPGIYSDLITDWRDFRVVDAPTITPETFAFQLLRRAGPVLHEHRAVYYFDLIAGYGLDPAIALAFFGKESEFGTYEHSPVPNKAATIGAKNRGNIRPDGDPNHSPGGRSRLRVAAGGNYGLFRGYLTWEDGLRDWCEKMLSATYDGLGLGEITPIYAPKKDGNDPVKYAATIREWVSGWRRQGAAKAA